MVKQPNHSGETWLSTKQEDPVPNGDFPVLHCLGIRSSVSGIGSYRIGKYMYKI